MEIQFSETDLKPLKKIVSLNHKIFKGMYEEEPYSLEKYKKRLYNKEKIIFIAKLKDQIIADSISFVKDDSLYLWVLGVSKQFRNQGIATKLLKLNEEYAKKRRINYITTKVYNVSTSMLGLCVKKGYLIVNIDKHKENPKYNTIHLKFLVET